MKTLARRKNYLPTLLVLTLIWLCFLVEPFKIFEEKTKDFLLLLRGERPSSGNIRIAGIDDSSLTILGRWPWPRDYHAEFIRLLSYPEFKPRVIGYDVLFTEPDAGKPEADAQLTEATAKAGNLCYAYFFALDSQGAPSPEEENKEKALLPFALKNVSGPTEELYSGVSVTLPLQDLYGKAAFGFINCPPDSDGVIRRLPLVMRHRDKVYPAFSLRLISGFLGLNSSDISLDLNKGEIAIRAENRTIKVPINKKGQMRINYLGPVKSFPLHSFLQIMNKGNLALNQSSREARDWLEQFRGKIVLVGVAATGAVDIIPTPLSQDVPGVFIQANAAENILSGSFLYEAAAPLRLAMYFAVGVLILIACSFLRPVKGAFCAWGIIAFYLGVSYWLLCSRNLVLEALRPVAGGLAVYGTVMLQGFMAEEGEKRRIRNAFSHYLSANILSQALKDPSLLKLGGVRRKIAVLFCDIRNFTSYCESRPPEEAVVVLNEFFEEMTKVIIRHGGTLDKYMGDEVMAFFGAPLEEDAASCAMRACRAALEMKEKLDELRKNWLSENRTPLEMGIGINTGFMIAGNIGSSSIMNYTVIGDQVNLASRLQRLTREYQKTILITESTYRENESKITAEFIGNVKLKGREEPVKVYALLGIREDGAGYLQGAD